MYVGYSVNYVLNETDVEIQDPQSVLKTYTDTNTDSGNHVQVGILSNSSALLCRRLPIAAMIHDSCADSSYLFPLFSVDFAETVAGE